MRDDADRPTPPAVLTTIAELRERIPAGSAALVPTMGALHEGHLALVERARELADRVVVSIFVNPLQFGPAEDLDKYPRDLEGDLALLAPLGVDAVFAPSVAEMYPHPTPSGLTQTRITGGQVGTLYEGGSRPGHFDGMLTVVAKLLGIARPSHVLFGQKDAQQVFLVQQMVRELDIAAAVEVVPTVRAEDGLALSSRNRYLDGDQRRAALALSAALAAARTAGAAVGGGGAAAALAAARAVIEGEPLIRLDYLEIVDPVTFLAVDDDFRGSARMLVAARVGPARLIDNDSLDLN